MHELGIAQDFWAVIKRQAQENGLKKVTKIIIVLGEASGIEDSFLTHSLTDHVLKGTLAEKAALEIIREPLTARCSACGRDIKKENVTGFNCPFCSSADIEIISGKETYVKIIEGE